MKDENKSRKQLLDEIQTLREQLSQQPNLRISASLNQQSLFVVEQMFRLLADNVNDFIWIYDLQLKPLYFSPSIEHLLGYSAREALALSIHALLPPRSMVVLQNALDEFLNDASHETPRKAGVRIHEMDYRRKDGNIIIAESKILCQRDAVGKPAAIMGIALDVSERMEALKTLSISEEKHRLLLNSINSPAIALDEDMYILYCNDAYAALMRRSSKEMERKNLLTINPDLINTQFYATYLDVLSTGVTHEVEGEFENRDIRARVYRTPWGILTICEDITEHKQAEMKLSESEVRFRTMAENIQDGLTIMEGGKVRYVNERACQIFGYPREELLRIDPVELTAPEEKVRLLEHIKKSDAEQNYVNELSYWIVRKDGTRRYIHNRYSISRQQWKFTSRYIVTTDITERKHAEDELRKLSMAVEQSPVSVVITNLDGKIEYINPIFTTLTGYEPTNAIGRDLRDLQYFENLNEVNSDFWEWLRDGHEWKGEFRNHDTASTVNYWESGTISPIRNTDGELTHFLKVAENVTEARASEEKIRFLGSVTEQVRDGIIVTSKDLKIIYVNRATEELCGFSQEDLLNQHPLLFSAQTIRDERLQEVMAAVSLGKSWNTTQLTRRKDGSTFWGEYKISPLYDKTGQLSSFIIIQRDITKRKKVEQELQKYREHLEELVRQRTNELQETNAELEAFVYSVSHDLKTPLRAIHGFSQILLEEYASQLDENGLKYSKRIIESTKRMETLIQDLLSYSRISRSEIHLVSVDLTEVIENILVNLESDIQTCGAQITIRKPLPVVQGHYSTLEQIVANLLMNAIKFVKADVHPKIEIWSEAREDYVRIYVKDNGIGIEPQYHERIFRVFERLHGPNVYPGTGIGLAIVRKGVERLEGQVGLESTPEVGSTFWFELKMTD